MTPIVPYNRPTVSVLSPKPPPIICPSRTNDSFASTRKGWHSFTKKPSLNRYRSIKVMANPTPGLVKNVTNDSRNSFHTSLPRIFSPFAVVRGWSSAARGRKKLWYSVTHSMITLVTPNVTCHDKGISPVLFSI